MSIEQISFDEHMEMYVCLEDSKTNVCLAVSDGLYAYEEELTEEYKNKIIDFLNHWSLWYPVSVQAVLDRGRRIYNIEVAEQDLQLMKIYILFEQNEKSLFGLSFRMDFDVEHGCGLKIDGVTYEVVEAGTADVAFC